MKDFSGYYSVGFIGMATHYHLVSLGPSVSVARLRTLHNEFLLACSSVGCNDSFWVLFVVCNVVFKVPWAGVTYCWREAG